MPKKVLIVDDDQDFLRNLQKALQKYSRVFSVSIAEDGLVAVEKLKKNKISLVVTDLEMPRIDGLTLLTHLKEHYPDIPAIVITGSSTPAKEEYALKQGVAGYMNKPFTIEDLAKKIITTLKQEADGGLLHGIAPGTFLQLLEMEQKTCTVRLIDDKSGNQGALFFKEGELLDARINELHGREAAYKILSWEEATLSIQETCSLTENKIQADLQAVLLEAMRLKDEEEPEDSMTQEEIDDYIVTEKEKEKEPEILLEEEKQEIVVEEDDTGVILAEAESPPDISNESETEPSEKSVFGDISQPASAEGAAISYTMADNIFGTLADLKGLIFGSAVARFTFRLLTLCAVVCLASFMYLFITLETEKDLTSQIDQTKAQISLKQETLYQVDEEIQGLYTIKEDRIKNNESQVAIMELELKISELEEKQDKILTETKIQQQTLEGLQIKLETIKRVSLFDRLLERAEEYLPKKVTSQ